MLFVYGELTLNKVSCILYIVICGVVVLDPSGSSSLDHIIFLINCHMIG